MNNLVNTSHNRVAWDKNGLQNLYTILTRLESDDVAKIYYLSTGSDACIVLNPLFSHQIYAFWL